MSSERILAAIVRKGGGRLLNRAVETALPAKTGKAASGRSLLDGIVGAAATRIAMRSVPGAIVVGGAALAKLLHDRRKARRAERTSPRP